MTKNTKPVSKIKKGDVIVDGRTSYHVIKRSKGYGEGEVKLVVNESGPKEDRIEGFDRSFTYPSEFEVEVITP